jgi:hypothetical protein
MKKIIVSLILLPALALDPGTMFPDFVWWGCLGFLDLRKFMGPFESRYQKFLLFC